MGGTIIYEAQQESPRRKVALKVLRPGIVDHGMLKRFQQEAHVLGQLQHPGIARIYEAGYTAEKGPRQPFFAMEFIDGEPLDVYAKAQRLDVNRRLELIARVADAVQHAHQKGIIHRDLKPSNILVVAPRTGTSRHTTTGRDEKSRASAVIDGLGQPTILDFGIARITDADIQTVTVQTEVGQLVGTLAYMSPEQVMGISEDIDTRSDIYALGVMLYELVTGKRPHDLAGHPVPEAVRIIRDVDPSTVSSLDSSLRGDVDTIVTKAMEKDRDRRYASAAEFAADIRRYLSHQPIEARPASTFYQLGKFAHRNTGLVSGLAATFAMLVVALIGTGYGLMQAKSQRDAATAATAQLQTVVDYQSAMLKDLDVAQMGRQIVDDLRSEARTGLAEGGDAATPQLAAFEQTLSRINATTIASRALDASILSRAVTALDTVFSSEPILHANMRATIAGIYDSIGLAQKSLEQARVEWETRRRILGEEDPDTLAVKQKICELQLETGEYEDAKSTAQDLLEVQRRVLGPDHTATLVSHRLLGVAYLKLTHPDEGREQLQTSLNGLEKTVGPKHPATLCTRAELGTYFLQQRDFQRAREAYEGVLRDYEDHFGPDHDDTLSIMGNLAQTHFLESNYDQALILLEQMCELRTAKKGADHPATLITRIKLGNSLTQLRRYETVEPIVLDTLARSRRVLGTDHPTTVVALSAGLRLMLKLRRWDEAEEYGLEALGIAERTLGPDNIRTLDARNDLAAVYLKSEKHEAAIQQGQLALSEYQRVLGADHRRTLIMQQVYAKILMSARRLDEAASALDYVVRTCRSKHAQTSTHAGALGLSVTTLVNLERGPEAEPLARELLRWCEDHSVDDATLGRCHLWIARAEFAQARYDEADQSLTRAIEYMTDHLSEDSWPLSLTRLLHNVIAVRRGATDRVNEVATAYRRLETARVHMHPEDRNTILPEVERILQKAKIDPSGHAE